MKINKVKYQIAAGVVLLVVGMLLLFDNYIKEKRDLVFSEMNLALSSLEHQVLEDESNTEENTESEPIYNEEEKDSSSNTYEEYLGIIDIPKINLHRGFYGKNSNLNNLKFNLYVLPESTYPDINSGNLIIAGHSGNYNNSYFRDLYKLEVNDIVNITYSNTKYVYRITNIYNEEKTGSVRIFRNKTKTTLTLITCTKDDKYHQTIYICELIEKE